jgi:hypothetical protein
MCKRAEDTRPGFYMNHPSSSSYAQQMACSSDSPHCDIAVVTLRRRPRSDIALGMLTIDLRSRSKAWVCVTARIQMGLSYPRDCFYRQQDETLWHCVVMVPMSCSQWENFRAVLVLMWLEHIPMQS